MSAGNGRGGGCGFLEYHEDHNYRNANDEPRRCSGLYPPRHVPIPPGPCWHDSGIKWDGEPALRCDLLAGHAGAHECSRGARGGTAVWTDADVDGRVSP